ncbi:hypothetical protein ABMA28_005905, partial [Loxostege sticticalis]
NSLYEKPYQITSDIGNAFGGRFTAGRAGDGDAGDLSLPAEELDLLRASPWNNHL